MQETAESYTDCFNVENFLRIFPDPDETFSNVEKQQVLDENATNEDVQYALNFVYNKYRCARKHSIDLLFKWKKKNLYQICEQLDRFPKQMRTKRPVQQLGQTNNVPLLQLVSLKI